MHTSKGRIFLKSLWVTFWRCLQYKAKQYFVGEDEMFCRSWQYYVNDRCVKGKVCSCLERIFRSKTHVFCNRSKIWFFHFCGKEKMGKKNSFFEAFQWECNGNGNNITSPYHFRLTKMQLLTLFIVGMFLLNLTVYFKAIEKNCFKQSSSFSRTFGNLRLNFSWGKQRFKMEVAE